MSRRVLIRSLLTARPFLTVMRERLCLKMSKVLAVAKSEESVKRHLRLQ